MFVLVLVVGVKFTVHDVGFDCFFVVAQMALIIFGSGASNLFCYIAAMCKNTFFFSRRWEIFCLEVFHLCIYKNEKCNYLIFIFHNTGFNWFGIFCGPGGVENLWFGFFPFFCFFTTVDCTCPNYFL